MKVVLLFSLLFLKYFSLGWDGVNESEDEDEWVPLSDSDDDDNGGVSNFF